MKKSDTPAGNLDEMRTRIDGVDRQILDLLNERYSIVGKIGEWKAGRGIPVHIPEREKALLDKLSKLNHGPMTDEILRSVYRSIISGSYTLERKFSIAYLGPEATFTHLAAKRHFGPGAEYLARMSIDEVFRDVESGGAEYGCVPVENSTEGVVNNTLDLLADSGTRICGEINMRIRQCLLSNSDPGRIHTVYSHPQSLAQCGKWLAVNLPGVPLVPASSNARAAELASREPNAAAIGSALAADVYGLKLAFEDIEDNPENTTRFLVIGRQTCAATGGDKTSVCFAVKDRVGALYDCLLPFKKHGIMLTMIESRPSKHRNWEYLFFVDMLGHESEERIASALKELEEPSSSVKVLGSYPAAVRESSGR